MVHKKKITNCIGGLVIFGFFAMLAAGCGPGLPKDLKTAAKALPDVIKTGSSKVDSHKEKYLSLTRSSEFKEIEPYAQKENWAKNFQLAHDELSRAEEIYDKDLKPLISKNTPELADPVRQQMKRIKKLIEDADELSRYPSTRFSNIRETILNAKSLNEKAKENVKQISLIESEIKLDPVAKAMTDFPDLTEKINARFAPLSKIEQTSRDHLSVVAAQYDRHAAGAAADYAALTDSLDAISSGLDQTRILAAKLKAEMKEPYSSYTKVFEDMKEEYFVTIKRESWNENSDYYDPGFASFKRQVSPELYEALTADNLDTIAAITPGFTGSKLSSNIGDLWKELAINPTEQWPGKGHNAASFWVEDANEAFFHKYILEEDGETRETGWEKVDESFYEDNFEYLGMAILAKPYGVFEQDRLIEASPPGMAYVGNEKYGEWKEDNTGSRFWSWYGKYAFFSSLFFFPPSYYHYNSWNGWNNSYRNKQPYFGKTSDGFQKYGTSGTYVKQSPRFQSTNFAKTGGFKSQTASVRGAGANLRGGGPKSKGK